VIGRIVEIRGPPTEKGNPQLERDTRGRLRDRWSGHSSFTRAATDLTPVVRERTGTWSGKPELGSLPWATSPLFVLVSAASALPCSGRMSLRLPSLALEADAESAKRARTWVRDALEGLDRLDLLDAAEVGVSELVTNALLHGAPPSAFVCEAPASIHVWRSAMVLQSHRS
jgi:hypothetical protein